MKLRPMILLCSLGLLAAQAGAEGFAATDAAVAIQSETPPIHRVTRSETKMAALGNMNNYQEGNASLAINKARPGVVTRNGVQLAKHANDGVNQTNANFVVCHPCQPVDRPGSCCAVGCD